MKTRVLLFLLAISSISHAAPTAVADAWSSLPLLFEPNRGQALEKYAVIGRAKAYSVAINRFGVDFLVSGQARDAALRVAQRSLPTAESSTIESKLSLARMKLLGASSRAKQPELLSPTGGVSNYFLGSDPSGWHTRIPHYSKVRVREVWPGIDIVYHSHEGQLEYDFVLEPGADSTRIQMVWDGAQPEYDPEGDVILATVWGRLRMRRPYVYQVVNGERLEIAARYEIQDDKVELALARYDPREELLVDPVLSFSARIGSGDNDFSNQMGVDQTGNVYVAGSTASVRFPTTPSAVDASSNGGNDAFVTKLDRSGTFIAYSTYLGGGEDDSAIGIAVDPDGNAFLVGRANSRDFPTTAGAYRTSHAGGRGDAFVAKLSPAGDVLHYSTLLGSAGDNVGQRVAVDAAGAAYVLSDSEAGFPTTPDVFRSSSTGYHVTKLNAQGTTLVYSTFLGNQKATFFSSCFLELGAITVDMAGNAHVVGCTEDPSFPITAQSFSQRHNGRGDVFVSKLNATGTALIYSTFAGGSSLDSGRALAMDQLGNALVAGVTESNSFPASPLGVLHSTYIGGGDGFVLKLDPNGQRIWATFLGGTGLDGVEAIATDSWSQVYLAGYSHSTNFPVTPDAFRGAREGESEPFFAVLNPTASGLVYSTLLGRAEGLRPHSVKLDRGGNVYLSGDAGGSAFPVTSGAVSSGGAIDFFVMKFTATNPPEPGAPAISSVTDGAAFQPVIASQGWVTIQGADLATMTRIWGTGDFRGNTMPTTLDGTSVRINGRSAAVYYISPTQLNVLPASDPTEGDVMVEVTTPRGTAKGTARLQRFAPGLFLLDPESRKYAAAVHAAGGLIGKVGLYPDAPNLTRPLPAGGRALLFGSGWGPTDPPQPDGEVFTTARPIVGSEHVRVTIGALPAQVEFAGAVGAGLYQFNIVAPASLTTGDHLLVVEFGSFRSQTNTYISVVGTELPPSISSLSTTEASPGQSIAGFVISGQSLADTQQVRANPAGITFSNLRAAQSTITVDLGVAADAQAGQRLISVATPRGESNSLSFLVRLGCAYSLSTNSISTDAAGGARTIDVQAPIGCAWQVSGEPSWITITSGRGGSGNGMVQFLVAANTTGSSRTASIQVATQTLTVTQSAASVTSATFAVDLAPLAQTTLIWDDTWFFDVPAGSKVLTVQLTTNTPDVDLDLDVLFEKPPDLGEGGLIVTDYRSAGLSGSETITLSGSDLRTGATTLPSGNSP